jgi:hypothetical protein
LVNLHPEQLDSRLTSELQNLGLCADRANLQLQHRTFAKLDNVAHMIQQQGGPQVFFF